MVRKYPSSHTFRCDSETQLILDSLLVATEYTKSELIRECIRSYKDSPCSKGWIFFFKTNCITIKGVKIEWYKPL